MTECAREFAIHDLPALRSAIRKGPRQDGAGNDQLRGACQGGARCSCTLTPHAHCEFKREGSTGECSYEDPEEEIRAELSCLVRA